MKFEVGETVVYPHHGAAEIIKVSKKTVRGESQSYLKLKVAQGDLIIEVPAANDCFANFELHRLLSASKGQFYHSLSQLPRLDLES